MRNFYSFHARHTPFGGPAKDENSALWGEKAQGSGRHFRRQAEMDRSGLCALLAPRADPPPAVCVGKGGAAKWMSFRQGRKRRIWSLRHGAPAKAQRSGFCGERSRSGMDELSPRAEAKDMELAATLSRFTPSATVAFPSSPGRSGRALPALGPAHRSGPGSLLPGVQRFSLSGFGLGAWPGRFRSDSGKIQIRCADLGFLPSLRSKCPYAPTLRTSSRTVPRWSSR